jgi:hypothetical protein
MCAKADYREGFRVLAAEWRRLLRGVAARWRRRPLLSGTQRPATNV